LTSTLVSLSKASSGVRAVQCGDTSMRTSGLASEDNQVPLKAAVMGFRDEWKIMEWPKRRTPLDKEP
jgi:hypothetical protein